MARKKVEKELTLEEKMEKCIKEYYDSLELNAKHINEPTYFFNVGDEVKFGGFSCCIIERVLEDGKLYLLNTRNDRQKYDGTIESTYKYMVAPWYEVRTLVVKDTNLTVPNNIVLNYLNNTVDSLLTYYYRLGVDMNPDYQRDFVWDLKDKEKLIDSIFRGIDIGKFVFVRLSEREWQSNEYTYNFEILDGKQRLSTLVDFYEDRFTYKGYKYSELSFRDKHTFKNATTNLAIVEDMSMKERYNLFLKVNNSGHVMSDEQLDKVAKLYASC